MEQPDPNDLTNISFDKFVSLIFERDIPPLPGKRDPSFYDVGVEFDAKKMCTYYMQLFRRPEFLVSRYTNQQLEEGFWAIMGHTVEWSAANIIDDSTLPLSSRGECIESMAVLFERLFAKEALDTSVHMWWDSLCHAWHSGNRNRERGVKIQNYKTYSFRRSLRFSELTPGFAREPLFTAWAISIIPRQRN